MLTDDLHSLRNAELRSLMRTTLGPKRSKPETEPARLRRLARLLYRMRERERSAS